MPTGVYERKPKSLATIEKISMNTKIGMAKPGVKEKQKKGMHKYWSSKANREKQSMACKGKTGKHPAWNKGKKGCYTKEQIYNMSIVQIKRLQTTNWHYKSKHGGIRKDLGHYCRSRFEANFCRVLKEFDVKYEYEPKAFELSNGTHYLPDLYFPETDTYAELKGYMYSDAKNKIELFKKEYPHIKFMVIMQDSERWKRQEKEFKDKIKEWEN
jgi:hypothetical protein